MRSSSSLLPSFKNGGPQTGRGASVAAPLQGRLRRSLQWARKHPLIVAVCICLFIYFFGGHITARFLGHHLRTGNKNAVISTSKANNTVTDLLTGLDSPPAGANPVDGGLVKVDDSKGGLPPSQRLAELEDKLRLCNIKVKDLTESAAAAKVGGAKAGSVSNKGGKNNKVVLVGVLTTAENAQRRALIRSTYLQLKPDTVDVFFVVGRPKTGTLRALVAMESKRYNDIIQVDVEEPDAASSSEGDRGKAFAFFEHASKAYNADDYSFVFKASDNVFVHLKNLESALSAINPVGTYYGRLGQPLEVAGSKPADAMNPSGYGFSWDIVKWLATNPQAVKDKKAHNEINLPGLLHDGNVAAASLLYDLSPEIKDAAMEATKEAVNGKLGSSKEVAPAAPAAAVVADVIKPANKPPPGLAEAKAEADLAKDGKVKEKEKSPVDVEGNAVNAEVVANPPLDKANLAAAGPKGKSPSNLKKEDLEKEAPKLDVALAAVDGKVKKESGSKPDEAEIPPNPPLMPPLKANKGVEGAAGKEAEKKYDVPLKAVDVA
ncbi:hypothetical protein HDU76_004618 [Blyttiomyces sp. JEL0837]|nr:hypothetical protein HDU76_004618 [Blyttiomyces sp. JEL0837]